MVIDCGSGKRTYVTNLLQMGIDTASVWSELQACEFHDHGLSTSEALVHLEASPMTPIVRTTNLFIHSLVPPIVLLLLCASRSSGRNDVTPRHLCR